MPEAGKRPCAICRRWFRPDGRVGSRQHACGKPECQTSRRQKTQAGWRRRNPGYAIAWRIDRRAAQTPSPPEPLRMPAPLNQLPWDVAKDQFGPQGADFIWVMGALIDDILYCPHAEGACNYRKPLPGMVIQAQQKWDIDLSASLLIGDGERDRLLAERCGIPFALVRDGRVVETAIPHRR